MSKSTLVRWSGLVLLLAGLCVAIPALLHPDEAANPSAMTGASWVPVHTVFIFSLLLMIFGLFGLYALLWERPSGLTTISFVLMVIGSVLTVSVLTIDAYVVPVLASNPAASGLLAETGPLFGGPLGTEFLLAAVTFALGTLLLGIDLLRNGTLPRGAGVLLLVGGPLMGFSGLLPHLIFVAGGLLLGASLIWLGYAIWAEPTVAVRREAMAARA
ncbi:MAG: hypothetical protein KF753_06600 [Caldilineaceae bacterium]|nr:hypothetical protein [Caldilineaceae bacterium]